MKNAQTSHYQNQITVNVSAREVYTAITRRIPEWWSADFEGQAGQKGDEFTVRFGPVFKTMVITEVDPFLRVVWTCIDQHIEAPPGIKPISNTKEWVGTKIFWMIDGHSDKGTILKHFHMGLTGSGVLGHLRDRLGSNPEKPGGAFDNGYRIPISGTGRRAYDQGNAKATKRIRLAYFR